MAIIKFDAPTSLKTFEDKSQKKSSQSAASEVVQKKQRGGLTLEDYRNRKNHSDELRRSVAINHVKNLRTGGVIQAKFSEEFGGNSNKLIYEQLIENPFLKEWVSYQDIDEQREKASGSVISNIVELQIAILERQVEIYQLIGRKSMVAEYKKEIKKIQGHIGHSGTFKKSLSVFNANPWLSEGTEEKKVESLKEKTDPLLSPRAPRKKNSMTSMPIFPPLEKGRMLRKRSTSPQRGPMLRKSPPLMKRSSSGSLKKVVEAKAIAVLKEVQAHTPQGAGNLTTSSSESKIRLQHKYNLEKLLRESILNTIEKGKSDPLIEIVWRDFVLKKTGGGTCDDISAATFLSLSEKGFHPVWIRYVPEPDEEYEIKGPDRLKQDKEIQEIKDRNKSQYLPMPVTDKWKLEELESKKIRDFHSSVMLRLEQHELEVDAWLPKGRIRVFDSITEFKKTTKLGKKGIKYEWQASRKNFIRDLKAKLETVFSAIPEAKWKTEEEGKAAIWHAHRK